MNLFYLFVTWTIYCTKYIYYEYGFCISVGKMFGVLWDYFLKLLDDHTDSTDNNFLHELTLYVLVDIAFLLPYNHKDHMHSVYLHDHIFYVVLDYTLVLLHNQR